MILLVRLIWHAYGTRRSDKLRAAGNASGSAEALRDIPRIPLDQEVVEKPL